VFLWARLAAKGSAVDQLVVGPLKQVIISHINNHTNMRATKAKPFPADGKLQADILISGVTTIDNQRPATGSLVPRAIQPQRTSAAAAAKQRSSAAGGELGGQERPAQQSAEWAARSLERAVGGLQCAGSVARPQSGREGRPLPGRAARGGGAAAAGRLDGSTAWRRRRSARRARQEVS
jgi:hypothetical protein